MGPAEPALRRANPFSKNPPPPACRCPLETSLPSAKRTPPEKRQTLPRRPAASTQVRDPISVPGMRSSLDRRKCIGRSEEHTSELQSQSNLVCRLLLEKKKDR